MKFVVDCMLGKLAKWLKILGFDTAYFSRIDDEELLALARKEKRTLLSKDHSLLAKCISPNSLYIESDSWQMQVLQVVEAFDLRKRVRPYSRCLECNEKLKKIPKSRARNLVVPFIWKREKSFAICPQCSRLFWPGTHYADMEFKLDEILKEK